MKRFAVLLALVLLAVDPALADKPVAYQGSIIEGGQPVTGTRYVDVRVYDAAFGGMLKYSQAESLQVNGGVFQMTLTAPDSVWNGDQRWIGTSINGGLELAPRVPVTWAPYAIRTAFQPFLVVRPPTSMSVNGDQWTKVDSVTIDAPTAGIVRVSVSGFASWTGSVTPVGLAVAIEASSPTVVLSAVRATSGGSDTMAATYTTNVGAGSHTFYLWVRVVLTGQSYFVNSQRLEAQYEPVN